MNPMRRAVTGLLRLVGTALLLFGILLGGMAAYRLYGGDREAGFPIGSLVGAVLLLAVGIVILYKSPDLAARWTEDFDD